LEEKYHEEETSKKSLGMALKKAEGRKGGRGG
jgi:hypothetical protein